MRPIPNMAIHAGSVNYQQFAVISRICMVDAVKVERLCQVLLSKYVFLYLVFITNNNYIYRNGIIGDEEK